MSDNKIYKYEKQVYEKAFEGLKNISKNEFPRVSLLNYYDFRINVYKWISKEIHKIKDNFIKKINNYPILMLSFEEKEILSNFNMIEMKISTFKRQ